MRRTLRIAAVALVSLAGRQALAATGSTTFTVTAAVAKACVITAGNLNLGSYDPTATSDLAPTGNSTISVTCTKNTTVAVSPLTTSNTFKMKSGGGDLLSYKLYQESARTTDWSTTGATKTTTAVATPVTFSVYGTVPKNQDVSVAADYSDTVTVQITF